MNWMAAGLALLVAAAQGELCRKLMRRHLRRPNYLHMGYLLASNAERQWLEIYATQLGLAEDEAWALTLQGEWEPE